MTDNKRAKYIYFAFIKRGIYKIMEGSYKDFEGKKSAIVSKSKSIKPKKLIKTEKLFWRNKLKLLQSPFNWELYEVRNDDKTTGQGRKRITEIEEKIKELTELDTLEYRKFVLNIVLVYEHFCERNFEKSHTVLCETEELLKSPSEPVGVLSKLVTDIKDALHHIVLACRYYMKINSSDHRGMKHTLKEIIPFEDLNNTCKAAICGIRATTLMEYGYEGYKKAIKHIKTALDLDSNQGEWHFLLGKCLGKLRRTENNLEIPSVEERIAIEEAVKKSEKNPFYIILLAQVYKEISYKTYHKQRSSGTYFSSTAGEYEMLDQQSLQLYREALELRPDSPHINMRCAQGLMKLPHPYKKITLAKKCLDKALQHQPNNSMANHLAGVFYDRFKKNKTMAKHYYARAGELGSFGSYMDLLCLCFNEDEANYNPIPDMETIFNKFTNLPHQLEIFMQMGSYYLFVKDDIENAFKFWGRVMVYDKDCEKLKVHKSALFHYMKPVNVYEVLCDESRLALQSNKGGKELLYQFIITICRCIYPACIAASPLPRRRMVLEERVNSLMKPQKHSSKRRGRGGKNFMMARENICGKTWIRRRENRGGGISARGRSNSGGEISAKGRGNRGRESSARGRGNRGGEISAKGRGSRGGKGLAKERGDRGWKYLVMARKSKVGKLVEEREWHM